MFSDLICCNKKKIVCNTKKDFAKRLRYTFNIPRII